MAYCGQATPENAQYLASKTGIDPNVALAWLKNECQSTPNPTNPLNILYYGTHGQTSKTGRFGSYPSTRAGLDHAAWLINNSGYYAGVRAAIATKNPALQARAIEKSPWAAGGYGGKAQPGSLSRTWERIAGTRIDWSKVVDIKTPISAGKSPNGLAEDAPTRAERDKGGVNINLDIPGAINEFGKTIGKLFNYAFAGLLIVLGFWLYSRAQTQRIQQVIPNA